MGDVVVAEKGTFVTTLEPGGGADLAAQYVYFYDESAFRPTDRDGFRRRIIHGDQLQLWFWRIAGGATGSVLHRHTQNEQLGIIVRGALDFRIGDPDSPRRHVLRSGDVYLAPTSVWHGDSVFIGDDEFGECWILDVFAPPRTDLLAGEERP
jgi:mannose-6-phosphate isomerase-like protein (cupin superfamily)